MKKNITCVICPNGCDLTIDTETLEVTGNKCLRGVNYAKQELTCPMRSITSTCKTIFEDIPVVPVKTNGEIKKSDIFEVMKKINEICINERLPIGSAVIKNILNSGTDVITTTDMRREK